MPKLKLHLDELQVESFSTAELAPAKGTVEGFAGTPMCTDGYQSCDFGTCGHSICICVTYPDPGNTWDCVYISIYDGNTCEDC